ncbi:MAG: isoprenylcysteine carboxylmethyltransferase family protein [Acidimicrobiia bacterium]|nr:isoprenylcysteine carboxylmethyltransferase family protein [Acidimicrobiia bacterium]
MGGFVERGGLWVSAQFVLLVAIVWTGRLDLVTFSFGGQQAVGWALIGSALVIGVGAALSLGGNLTPYPKPVAAGTMVEHGLYRVVRHPIYTAVIVGMIGIALRGGDWVSLALAIGLVPFFYAKSTFEEGHLVEQYPSYVDYQRRVQRRMVPGIL